MSTELVLARHPSRPGAMGLQEKMQAHYRDGATAPGLFRVAVYRETDT